MTPLRSNAMKSDVVARLVVIPHRDTDTYVTWNVPSMNVIRGSSTPYSSSAASGPSATSLSTVKCTPSRERATRRCEICAR